MDLDWIWKSILTVLAGTFLLRVAGRKSIAHSAPSAAALQTQGNHQSSGQQVDLFSEVKKNGHSDPPPDYLQ